MLVGIFRQRLGRFLPVFKKGKLFASMKRYRNMGSKDFSVYQKIYDVVGQIPKGKVATYGQVARVVGRITARMVGYAMAALRGRTDVPWQRVINYKGEVSVRAHGDGNIRQRKLLAAEGIRFDSKGRVDLKKVRWNGATKRTEDRETNTNDINEFP
jgi:methylated-DNA-protein-cysteine methyltransferase related protein